jgi:hypothetical protein
MGKRRRLARQRPYSSPRTAPRRISLEQFEHDVQEHTGVASLSSFVATSLCRVHRAHKSRTRVAPKYFGLSFEEARRRAPSKMLPCKAFRLGGQKSPWLVSAADLADLIDRQRVKAG